MKIKKLGNYQASFVPPSPELVVTNRIPWDYNPGAYSELADKKK